jgi:glutamate synthase domain-containing protein 3
MMKQELSQILKQSYEINHSELENLLSSDLSTRINELITLNDYSFLTTKRSILQSKIQDELESTFSEIPPLDMSEINHKRVVYDDEAFSYKNTNHENVLYIDAANAPAGDEMQEYKQTLAKYINQAYFHGWKNIVIYNTLGQKYIGSGLGVNSIGLKLDIFGISGQYLASGLDGAQITAHGNGDFGVSAQDNVANIMRSGKLVVYGSIGQAFGYGMKGGSAYILGNTAGRPLINAVGNPKVIINGTSLDYLAESFMASDPLKGGGFVLVNGIEVINGVVYELNHPYPGSNLFSLASGGAVYIRDPYNTITTNQLNGGKIIPPTIDDWQLLQTYFLENQRLFGIQVIDLMNGNFDNFYSIYKKIIPT